MHNLPVSFIYRGVQNKVRQLESLPNHDKLKRLIGSEVDWWGKSGYAVPPINIKEVRRYIMAHLEEGLMVNITKRKL